MALEVEQFPCLSDNYGLLVHEPASQTTAAIDTPEVAPILEALARRGWTLNYIFNTHHHFDHAGGNEELKHKTQCRIIGPKAEADKIAGLDETVRGGDTVALGSARAHVLDVGGHTNGHIAYHFAEAQICFVGDSLFALGCGRMFEGTPKQFWRSLTTLKNLPPQTTLYCAHEYTAANARFALSVDPDNAALVARAQAITKTRAANRPTVPMRLADELKTNPFLRADTATMRARLQMPDAPAEDVFAELRRRKDSF